MSYNDVGDLRTSRDASSREAVLLRLAIEMTGEHDLEALLRRVVEGAATVTASTYAALAVYDEQGIVTRFVHHGMDSATVARIGEPPRGRGLLGATVAADGPVRIADLRSDSRSCGFPAHHPPMRSFLGAPVGRSGRHFGNLYLTDPIGRSTFDADDEALVMTLAALAAGAIEGFQLLDTERARADALAGRDAAVEIANTHRELLVAVIAAQESERARVARDLHDDIGQALTSVLLGLRLLETPTEPATERSHADRIDDLRRLVADALRRTRQLAFELRPTVLDDLGLAPAVQRLTADLAERSGLTVDVAVDGLPPREQLSSEISTVVYRVVQEALTNVVRHARASNVSVSLTAHGGRLRAVVEDDGDGFDPAAQTGQLGLQGMRERTELVGGTLQVVSSPGSGVSVVLDVPL
jgi:signal transduction histidine kinase